LELSADEFAIITPQLQAIVAYVDQLRQVDTKGVEPMAHPLPIQNVFRNDEPAPCLSVDAALANAPARQGDFYRVPPVLD
jgi:aspartyl-tRNA(Asn)/glutamyl-tRNA(Gln) amidotransferase subunit C